MLTLSVNRLAADVQSALGHKIQLHHLSAKPVNSCYSILQLTSSFQNKQTDTNSCIANSASGPFHAPDPTTKARYPDAGISNAQQ